MANINPIANGETGISVRNKLNALITKAQTTSGSLNILSGSFEDFSGSYVTESGSLADRITDNSGSIAVLSSSYQLVSASYTEFSSSYIVDSGSFSASIAEVSTSLAPISASIALLSSSFLTVSESYYQSSASFSASIAELSASLQPLSASIALLSSSYEDFSASYNSGSFSGSFQGDGSGLTGLDIPEGGLECVDTYVKYAQGNPEYPTPIAYTGTTFSVATQAELVTALTNAVQGDIISLTADIDVTSTVTVNKGVRITGNGFAIQNANTSNTVVHILDITAANVYIDSTLTVKQRKTNNTSVDSAIRVNGTNFVSEAIVEFMEFGYVLNNGTFSISGELRYRGALGNSHRHIAVYGMSGNSKIENLSFDFVQETTARANLIVLLGSTVKQGTLRVANTVMTTADYCRQFFFLEAWAGITPRNFNLIFHNNVFNDLNGGIGLFAAPQPPLDYFGYISLTNNIQGDAAQLSSGYKGLVFFDGGTNKDLGTTDLYYSRNEPADLPLRADYTSAYEGIAYRNTIFTNNIPLVPISDCRLLDTTLGAILDATTIPLSELSSSFVDFSSSYNTGSFTGSFFGEGKFDSVEVNGDLIVTGKVVAQTFETQLVSASIIYESGSTKFGDSMDDTHQFTGSVQISGSLIVNSVQIASASIASGSISNAISASYIPFSGVEGLLEYTSSISASITQLSSSFEIVSASYSEASASLSASIAELSSSFVDFSASYNSGSFSGSFQGDGSGLTGVGGDSFPYTGSAIISGSLTVTGSVNISGSLTINGVSITNNGGGGGSGSISGEYIGSGSISAGDISNVFVIDPSGSRSLVLDYIVEQISGNTFGPIRAGHMIAVLNNVDIRFAEYNTSDLYPIEDLNLELTMVVDASFSFFNLILRNTSPTVDDYSIKYRLRFL
jgi:hypothetical protein